MQAECSRKCLAVDCDGPGIRYGKYCGVGHTGCAGEKPCDGVDTCCKQHDNCTGKRGVLDNACHRSFISCLKKQQTSGAAGFSRKVIVQITGCHGC